MAALAAISPDFDCRSIFLSVHRPMIIPTTPAIAKAKFSTKAMFSNIDAGTFHMQRMYHRDSCDQTLRVRDMKVGSLRIAEELAEIRA